jgi:hypothetical protein
MSPYSGTTLEELWEIFREGNLCNENLIEIHKELVQRQTRRIQNGKPEKVTAVKLREEIESAIARLDRVSDAYQPVQFSTSTSKPLNYPEPTAPAVMPNEKKNVPESRQLANLPPSPNLDSGFLIDSRVNRVATIRARIAVIVQSLVSPQFQTSIAGVGGAEEQVSRLMTRLGDLDRELTQVPTISVALLGPSRHGKSTLLNALAQCDILPMSDIKPCTASIVSLKRAEQWGFELKFIDQRRLLLERKQAVEDAYQYLDRVARRFESSESADDPQYIYSILQRFIQLLRIDPNLPPQDLVRTIETTEIPPIIQRLLGQVAKPRSADLDEMKNTVEKYLSTKDIYWTIVDSCEISGPFTDWHPNLKLVDVPGTNDTDPHRTAITNRLRKTAKAVAICTSDSNLGPDIQSWLRNSSVLADFLEASEQSRQHLFILRTKFDAYHPQIDESLIDENDDESEDRLMQEAIAVHKRKQTESYREMFRNIATPLLPLGAVPEERAKRDEMVARINGINVFFVSALAHEAFAGRLKAGARTKRQLSEHFHDDPEATGIPALKRFSNQLADEYLNKYFFQDIERRLRTEVDLLVRFFRQQWTTLNAELSGGSNAIARLVKLLDQRIIPSLKTKVDHGVESFRKSSKSFSSQITNQLRSNQSKLKEKLAGKQAGWRLLHWNSLRAVGRKNGVHMTYQGSHIDFNNDICSLFLDDVSLSWTTFRDTIVHDGIERLIEDISQTLQQEIDTAASESDAPEATDAIDAIASNLSSIARSHRDYLRREVGNTIQELESIRQPAYESVRTSMIPVYQSIALEAGGGCHQRMIAKLIQGSDTKLAQMWTQVSSMVESTVTKLGDSVLDHLQQFGRTAATELRLATNSLTETGKVAQRERLMVELENIRKSALFFWESLQETTKTVVFLSKNPSVVVDDSDDIVDVEFESESMKGLHTETPYTSARSEATPSTDKDPTAPTQVRESQGKGIRSEYSWLLESPVYLVQKSSAGRVTPDESQLLLILDTLSTNGFTMTVTALGENADLPVFRLRGLLASLQRILNIDGQPILDVERSSDTVAFNDAMLRQEFLTQ